MQVDKAYTGDIAGRFKYAYIMIFFLFIIMMGRLYYLQLIKGEFYRFFSNENSIKAVSLPAPRGAIHDRRGNVLVENRPSYNIVIIPQYVVDADAMIASLSQILSLDIAYLKSIWAKRTQQARYQPLYIMEDASLDMVARVRGRKNPWHEKNNPYDLRGVEVQIKYERDYSDPTIATHILGYVREIDGDRLKRYQKEYPGVYRLGDQVGVRGIEERWDTMLRGEKGYEERIVNAVGREVFYEGISDQLEYQPSKSGYTLELTIDRDLQKIAHDLFAGRKGAAVVVDVNTGAIRLLYSSPSYDLSKLTGTNGQDYWKTLVGHQDRYLLNRVIQGSYPPASTYKVITGIAALNEKTITPHTSISCNGAYHFGGRAFHCWRKVGHGLTSFHHSIEASCDVFYYITGLRLGVDRIAKYAHMFGLGQPTGISLDDERAGLIPTSDWKVRRFGTPWQRGETLSIAVGQGYDLVTPLHNALVAALIANDGHKLDLHLVESVHDVDGNLIQKWQPSKEIASTNRIDVRPEVLKIMKNAMTDVVKSPYGTAHRQSRYTATMGGKTGTAQVVSLNVQDICRSEKCRDHAWFIGFSPSENTEIAAAVIVEHGGFGASAAAPIVGAIFQKYYEIQHGITKSEVRIPK